MSQIEQIKRLLAGCAPEERRQLRDHLRMEFPIHALEAKFDASAEMILEAIDRAADITQRGVRGVIAELAFSQHILSHLEGWKVSSAPPEASFDSLIEDESGPIKIQVKLQRMERGQPGQYARSYSRAFKVETWRTRSGTNEAGEATRPYRFGEFDILAVSLHPSTRDWSRFTFTVANWLLPTGNGRIRTMQPVCASRDHGWTNDLEECITWLRSGIERRIFGVPIQRPLFV